MEALIGVVIGGVIGYGAAITTLLVEHRRWKKEFKLQYLITERIRREEHCDKINELLKEVISEGSFNFEFIIKILIRLPDELTNLITKAWRESDLSDDKGKQKLYRSVSLVLGTYLSKIDKQIEELTQ